MTPVDFLFAGGVLLALLLAVYVFGLVMAMATVVIATERSKKKRERQWKTFQERRREKGYADLEVGDD